MFSTAEIFNETARSADMKSIELNVADTYRVCSTMLRVIAAKIKTPADMIDATAWFHDELSARMESGNGSDDV